LVKIISGLELGEQGIAFLVKNTIKFSFIILSLNFLLKGPTYDTKDEAKSTSPITYSKS